MPYILLKLNNNSINSTSFIEIKNRISRCPLDKFIVFFECPDILTKYINLIIKNSYGSLDFIEKYYKNIINSLKINFTMDKISNNELSREKHKSFLNKITSIIGNIILMYLQDNKIEAQLSSSKYILNRRVIIIGNDYEIGIKSTLREIIDTNSINKLEIIDYKLTGIYGIDNTLLPGQRIIPRISYLKSKNILDDTFIVNLCESQNIPIKIGNINSDIQSTIVSNIDDDNLLISYKPIIYNYLELRLKVEIKDKIQNIQYILNRYKIKPILFIKFPDTTNILVKFVKNRDWYHLKKDLSECYYITGGANYNLVNIQKIDIYNLLAKNNNLLIFQKYRVKIINSCMNNILVIVDEFNVKNFVIEIYTALTKTVENLT